MTSNGTVTVGFLDTGKRLLFKLLIKLMKNRGRTFYISVAQNIKNCSKTVDLTYILNAIYTRKEEPKVTDSECYLYFAKIFLSPSVQWKCSFHTSQSTPIKVDVYRCHE